MISLLFLVVSAIIGVISGLTAPEINDKLEPWNLRVAIGLVVFLIVQFVILTPIRMWRNAVWVINVEKALDALWDLHDEGVLLMNTHVGEFMETHPDWRGESEAKSEWIQNWIQREREWRPRMESQLKAFAPAEARRSRNVMSVTMILSGLDEIHTHHLNILRVRLERIGATLERYHPALLPE